jgi:hypothetical protein
MRLIYLSRRPEFHSTRRSVLRTFSLSASLPAFKPSRSMLKPQLPDAPYSIRTEGIPRGATWHCDNANKTLGGPASVCTQNATAGPSVLSLTSYSVQRPFSKLLKYD